VPDAVVVEDSGEVEDAVVVEDEPEEDEPVSAPVSLGNGSDGNWSEPTEYDGVLPDGAPMVRRPERSRDRDARFSALLLALQGRDRGHVEKHLRSEYELDDCGPILDEVFGRADARA
jgi:hypothetical protein